jgi:ClpP class serine protease
VIGVIDILWIFHLVSTLQPIIKQPYLEASGQRLIGKIERKRGSRVILLVHREETMSLLGFPIYRYIDINDSEQVLRGIHVTDPEMPLDPIVHTPAGWSWPRFRSRGRSTGTRGKSPSWFPITQCPEGG